MAVLSSHNLDLLPRSLETALAAHGLKAELYLSPFGQYQQEVLRGDSPLYTFRPTHTLLLLDYQDVFGDVLRSPFGIDPGARADRQLAELTELLERLHETLPSSVIIGTLAAPPRNALRFLEYNSEHSLRGLADAFNAGLRQLARQRQRTFVLDCEGLAAWVGHRDWYDERLWYLARMRWSHTALQALAAESAALVHATVRAPKKCLILDLDDTLWGGAVGEGSGAVLLGMDGVGLAYRELQEELLNLHQRGILLAIASKNNWDDAIDVIDNHPAMVLRRRHFAALRINWQDKATNLREIAAELQLGLDAFVLLDDDPAEREWVRSQLPEVETPAPPRDPALLRRFLLEIDAFATLSLTEEDQARGALYEQRARVEDLRRTAPSLDDFYASLEMRATIALASERTRTRIAQLTQRTNQFNLTTRRYSDEQIADVMRGGAHRVYALSLADRFGDHGLVGVGILKRESDASWRIDTLLLSCRVMGRTVETAFLAHLVEEARRHGARRLVGEYLPTKKNAPVKDLFAAHGFAPQDESGQRWAFDLVRDRLDAPSYIGIVVQREGEVSLA